MKEPDTFGEVVPQMSSQVVDPVCGMRVDPANSAGSFGYKGTTYHFCSIRCLEKFKSDPDSFLTHGEPPAAATKGKAPRAARATTSPAGAGK